MLDHDSTLPEIVCGPQGRPRQARRGPGLGLLLGSLALLPAAAGQADDAPEMSWSPTVEVARGGAQVGPWRMNESDWRYVDDPTVAVDGQGRAAVAWAAHARKDILLQRFAGDGRPLDQAPINVSRSPGVFSWLPRLVLGPDGEVYVLWQEIVFSGGSHGGDTFFARTTGEGHGFSEPLNLSASRAGDGKGRLDADSWHNGSLDLARGADGTLYAAWSEYEGRLWLSRSGDGGRSFSAPLQVAGGPGEAPARGPDLAAGPDGRVYLAWTVGDDPAADIRVAVSTDGGRTFSAGRVVAATGGHADAPKLAVDSGGTLHLAYGESPDGPRQRYAVRYTRSTDGGASFAGPRIISGGIPSPYDNINYPGLRVDGADNLYVLMHLAAGAGKRPRTLALAWSSDGGRSFSAPAPLPGLTEPARGITGSLQGYLVRKLDVNAAGAVAVVNSTFMPSQGSHVRLARGALKPGANGAN